jgi:hypothetical protein
MIMMAQPAWAQSDVYVPYSGIVQGTQGADRVGLSVLNQTGQAMVCTAALAHWYSQELGEAAPGVSLGVELWHDPQTGVLNVMNATDSRMPVEAIWCAVAGNVTATRTRIALPFSEGSAPAEISAICREDGARLICEAPQS